MAKVKLKIRARIRLLILWEAKSLQSKKGILLVFIEKIHLTYRNSH